MLKIALSKSHCKMKRPDVVRVNMPQLVLVHQSLNYLQAPSCPGQTKLKNGREPWSSDHV